MNDKKIPLQDIGRVIAHKRKQLGWTQTDLSNIAGISQMMVSRIESGDMNYDVWQLHKILDALNIRFYVTEYEYPRVAIP